MPKRIRITVILLLIVFVSAAQVKLNYPEVEKKSYSLYQEKNWEELIRFAGTARSQGIDFFYLQARTAIAFYNLGKFREAAGWFLKAWDAEKSFEWLQEYLYYSLVYSGRYAEARKYSKYFTPAIIKKTGAMGKGIKVIAYEAGYSFNPSFGELSENTFADEVGLNTDYGEANLLKNYLFQSFGLSHQLSPNLYINHNFTYIGLNRETFVDWDGQSSSPVRVNQFQYFLNPVMFIGEKLNISPSVNLVFGNSEVYAGGIGSDLSIEYNRLDVNYNDMVFSLSTWSDFGNFSPGLEINTGELNDSKFTQLSSWVTWYPLSNAKLYFTPRAYFKSGDENFAWNAFGISGGTQAGPIHFYGQYLFGDMENFIESAGYLIYNFPGKSTRKIAGSIYFPYGKKYRFVFRYINQSITETYQVYTEGIKSNSLEYDYLKHTITGGISWNF